MKKRLHVVVYGKVQGVNYRWATYQEATKYNLTGWAKNLPDRKVEAIFEGEESDLFRVLDFVKKGPPSAGVTSVEEYWSEATGDFADFTIES